MSRDHRAAGNAGGKETEMRRSSIGARSLLAFAAGVALGGIVLGAGLVLQDWWRHNTLDQTIPSRNDALRSENRTAEKAWPPPEYDKACRWCYLAYGQEGWITQSVGTFENLGEQLKRTARVRNEIVIPIFPSVFQPDIRDKVYYDAIRQSAIEPGHKVLVIGCGSGADTWAAWLKSKTLVHAIDINPMAIVNTYATARLGGYQVEAVAGDITNMTLPAGFRDFDFVLWNMPFIQVGASHDSAVEQNFYDGDDGTLLRAFLALLPSLLKDDGTAILLNSDAAQEHIAVQGVTTESDRCMLFMVPHPAARQ